MTELRTLKNIGKEMERKLKSIGISSVEELQQVGSREAFSRLRLQYPLVCPVHLYSLEGALLGTEYNQLPVDTKQSLKDFAHSPK
ncbi:MAG: TfoX/Sxy family protein [Coriobacteriia bacterium]|nr:TfoX/Sxy family protein [Coriobacteriia bacterium]